LTAGPLLQVQGLSVCAGEHRLVDGLSFEIDRGECLAMLGESGSGKTLAARAVIGLLPPGVCATGGQVRLEGEDVLHAAPERLRMLRGPALGMVFQEPLVSLNPAHRIGTQMAEGLNLHATLGAEEIRARSITMLERIGISDPERCLRAFPHEFSGGMRQRIMLASVMLLAPRLLIADEPTTALDTLAQRDVLDLMRELARDHGTAVLLITHNLALASRYAQRALVMRRGQVVETGPVADLLGTPGHEYTRGLLEALPRRGKASAPAVPPSQAPVLEARGVEVRFEPAQQDWWKPRQTIHAVRGVDLEIHAGETVAVVGASGSGKTTLGRALLQLVRRSAGEIRYRGQLMRFGDRKQLAQFRLACQLVFQHPFSSLDPRQCVADILEEALVLQPELGDQARQDRVREVLAEVGLQHLARRFPHELSGGQRQRVAIARAIVRRPAFVVADEPVSALDMTIQAQVLALFQQLQRQHGFACLFISHDLAAVEQVADRVLVMHEGRIVEFGTRDQVFDAPSHPHTRSLLEAAPRLPPLQPCP